MIIKTIIWFLARIFVAAFQCKNILVVLSVFAGIFFLIGVIFGFAVLLKYGEWFFFAFILVLILSRFRFRIG